MGLTRIKKTYLVVGLAVYIVADNKQPKLADRPLLKQKHIILSLLRHLIIYMIVRHCLRGFYMI
jgi:hypothetical protein